VGQTGMEQNKELLGITVMKENRKEGKKELSKRMILLIVTSIHSFIQ
jgi:hypothetical protein